jgi:hypothetical protein
MTNVTGLPLSTGVTGTLPIANGGTGTTSTTFVNLATNVTGNLPVTNLGSGTSASASTFWRGDGSWAAASPSAATATALGTVYGRQTTSGGTPYLTAYGYNAGVNSTGTACTAVGVNALTTASTGTNLTAIGYLALQSNTTGSDNVAIGNSALKSITTGGENVAIGSEALMNYTGTGNSTAIGNNALRANTTGSYNTAIGWYAMRNSSTSTNNVAVGTYALYANTTGTNNVCVGNSAGNSITTGTQNQCFGLGAGSLITTGSHNTCIGRGAGENNGPSTGNSNLIIGYDARASTGAADTQLVVAARQSATAKGDNTGFIDGGTGGIYQGNNSANWSTTSDRRLKKNIVNNNVGLEKITQIQVRNFEYRLVEEITELPSHAAIQKEGVQLGVIAQELQQILPDCVKTETTGVMSVDSDNLTWYMINAIKELKAEFDAYKLTHP